MLLAVPLGTPAGAEEETVPAATLLAEGLRQSDAGRLEAAHDAFVSALDAPGDAARMCLEAAAHASGWGESALAVRLLERMLAGADPALQAESTRADAEKALEHARSEAERELRIREKTLPQLVLHVVKNLTRHKHAIPTKWMTRGVDEGQFVLKEEHRSVLWHVEAAISGDKDRVGFDYRERHVAKADAEKRFETLLETLRSQQKRWDRRFALRKEMPGTVSEEWEPPGLPFPEEEMQVQRRTIFRWNVEGTVRRYVDTIASLSLVQFRHPTSEDPDAYGGHYVLRLILLGKDFR